MDLVFCMGVKLGLSA